MQEYVQLLNHIDIFGKTTTDAFKTYTEKLPLSDRFLLEQYTHHGDVIINSFLRGEDTIETYKKNIIDPIRFNPKFDTFFCIFMDEIFTQIKTELNLQYDILTLYYEYKNLHTTKSIHNANLSEKAYEFSRAYASIYTIISNVCTDDDISNDDKRTFFRSMTYTIIQKLIRIIKHAPRSQNVFTVYRGVNELYLSQNPNIISKLLTFHSTTFDLEDTAKAFGREKKRIYIFKVHPDCMYMYMESLTLHKGEHEVVLTPGNRYVYLSEEVVHKELPSGKLEGWSYLTYAVLPPEQDYELPETYEGYMEQLQSVQAEHTLAEQNRTRLSRVLENNGRWSYN